MPIVKMKYGIDLGTTNSSLCKIENGKPSIIRTDTLKETLPSCVSFTKKQAVRVGDGAYNDLRADRARATKKWTASSENVFLEFKRTMGLDKKYVSSNMDRSYTSEELSAEVLKTLLSFANEKVQACVITIPAKFKTDQIAATKRASELAGITHCELLQEPIAAAIAYGINASEKDGNWLVFDFGGGTFDAALLNVQDGILQVKDTEGDNYLGGKNLDFAIVDKIFIPYLQQKNSIDGILENSTTANILREGLKFYAEQAKNALSSEASCDITSQLDEFGNDDNGKEIELDLTITQEEIKPVLTPFFQKAVDICKKLLERNNLTGDRINSLILVGGPTQSPLLRDMLREQVTPNVNTHIDPMTAVSLGSSLYASTIDYNEELSTEDQENVVALAVNYESNTVETLEFVSIKVLRNECVGTIPNTVYVQLVRSDESWASEKVAISEEGEVVECLLEENKPNSLSIRAFDENGKPVTCFPNEINILQGTKIANAVLPYYIGIEVTDVDFARDVFSALKGLEKNVTLPAQGTSKHLHVPMELRPGNLSDRLVLPVYQGEYDANGTVAIYNDHVFDVVITGEDVNTLIPRNSSVEITIKVDRSQMMTLEANFPITGETVEKDIEVSQRKGISITKLKEFHDEAKEMLSNLKKSKLVQEGELDAAEKIMNDVNSRYESEEHQDDGRMHLLADLRRAFLEMEKVDHKYSWLPIIKELDTFMEKIEKANRLFNSDAKDEIEAAKKQIELVKEKHDTVLARRTLDDLKMLYTDITYEFQVLSFVQAESTNFNPTRWTNPKKAKALLADAQKLFSSPNLSRAHIMRFVDEIRPLLIFSDKNKAMQF